MAGIHVGSSSRRTVDHSLPLLPFIDFMLCMVAFLLVTAVWSQMARLESNVRVPGDQTAPPQTAAPASMHVMAKSGDRFLLEWKHGNTVVSAETVHAPRVQRLGGVAYPALAKAVERLWRAAGTGAPARVIAVLHTPNAMQFVRVAAIMDAIYATHVDGAGAPDDARLRAFNVALATK